MLEGREMKMHGVDGGKNAHVMIGPSTAYINPSVHPEMIEPGGWKSATAKPLYISHTEHQEPLSSVFRIQIQAARISVGALIQLWVILPRITYIMSPVLAI